MNNDNFDLNETQETSVITEDLRLPPGSAVIQCILHREEGTTGGFMDIRAVLVGGQEIDPTNPAHRWLQAVARRMEDILAEVEGMTGMQRISPDEAEERLLAANQQMLDAPQPGEVLQLSNGQTVVVQDEAEQTPASPLAGIVDAA